MRHCRRHHINVGPAGFDYQDWAGTVYPKPKPRGFDPLAYLARYFDTVEINATFYRPMAADVVRGWASRVDDNPHFRFAMKLWRRFTHERSSPWDAAEVRQARAGLDAMQDEQRLGAVLVQFPWSFRRDEANDEWLHALISAFDGLPLAVEVRHASWNTKDFYAALVERGVGIVNIDQPLFRNSIRPSSKATSAVGYVRVHGRAYQSWFRKSAGRDERYDYLYSAQELEPWVERTREIAANPRVEETYVVTNNHLRGQAPANALMIEAMLEGAQVAAPPELLRTYERVLRPYVLAAGVDADSARSDRATGTMWFR
jgi:uncharacterized protein YecE (DUF72 family)